MKYTFCLDSDLNAITGFQFVQTMFWGTITWSPMSTLSCRSGAQSTWPIVSPPVCCTSRLQEQIPLPASFSTLLQRILAPGHVSTCLPCEKLTFNAGRKWICPWTQYTNPSIQILGRCTSFCLYLSISSTDLVSTEKLLSLFLHFNFDLQPGFSYQLQMFGTMNAYMLHLSNYISLLLCFQFRNFRSCGH